MFEELKLTEDLTIFTSKITNIDNSMLVKDLEYNCDVSKQVKIEHLLSENKKSITFIITDEGSGFDYNNLADPTAPENIEDFGGRGVFLMKQLADVTIFQKQGSIVELTFKL